MTENYELPVLFTEEERKAYASWGIKKEKLLMPFAIATILIYAVTAAFVVMKVWGVRDSDHWRKYHRKHISCKIQTSLDGTPGK